MPLTFTVLGLCQGINYLRHSQKLLLKAVCLLLNLNCQRRRRSVLYTLAKLSEVLHTAPTILEAMRYQLWVGGPNRGRHASSNIISRRWPHCCFQQLKKVKALSSRLHFATPRAVAFAGVYCAEANDNLCVQMHLNYLLVICGWLPFSSCKHGIRSWFHVIIALAPPVPHGNEFFFSHSKGPYLLQVGLQTS